MTSWTHLSGPWRRALIPLLFALSGFTGLVYQVLWLKELGLLFGSASQATATTLTVFFMGLALGGWFWGRLAPRLARPLSAYGWLEVGIGISGLAYFLLLDLYAWLYTPLYAALGEAPGLLLAAKFFLAVGVLLPPAFLMGGTFPLIGQHRVGSGGELGRIGSFLYGVNTLGAACGALAAGFWLPLELGFTRSYLVAVVLSLVVGGVAILAGREAVPRRSGVAAVPRAGSDLAQEAGSEPDPEAAADSRDTDAGPAPGESGAAAPRGAPLRANPTQLTVLALASASGFLTLGLEVVWTRMFAQVLQNSVYTFSTILVVFLLALASGSLVANRLCRWDVDRWLVLAGLLGLAGLAAAATPFLFYDLTDGLRYLGSGEDWPLYVTSIFVGAGLVLLGPGVLVGSVFPYLLRLEEPQERAPGVAIGRLVSLNTAGAIGGSLVTGFALLGWLGMWRTVQLFGLGYLALAALAVSRVSGRRRLAATLVALGVLALAVPLNAGRLPLVRLDPERDERLLEAWEGHDGVVAVVERDSGRRIKVNNYYSLGGTASTQHEQNQALIPLISHPTPRSVFFLGMGTGITAGAALRLPTERVVVCELVPEVVEAARRWFGEHAGGLFSDPRARVLARDGRNHLRGTDERYDVIIADLFIPWRAGVGSLYTLEHYRAARERLRPGGRYVQWLPMYQLSEREFFLIARTFLDVFPQVTVWRGDFFASKPILALVGHDSVESLDPAAIVANGRALERGPVLPDFVYTTVTLPFYVGNLSEVGHLLPAGPQNTDDRPRIEYLAPITHRRARAGEARWFTGMALADFLRWLRQTVPGEQDPFLARLDEKELAMVGAGLDYHLAAVYRSVGERERARRHVEAFAEALPLEFRPETDDRDAYTEAR